MSLALRRGLAYPRAHDQAYRCCRPGPFFTRARLLLLEGAGEEEFTRAVKACAHFYGWCGNHLRDSEGVLESIHTLRIDGFSDALGIPDWEFWHEDLGQHFRAELKGASGSLGKHQKRMLPSLRKGGYVCFEWWPKDAPEVERVFRYGLESVA